MDLGLDKEARREENRYMQTVSLVSLQQEAKRQYALMKARKRERYRLAKDLGFSSTEAKVLSGRSETYIRALAQQLDQKA